MAASVDMRIDKLVEAAARADKLAVPASPADATAMLRRCAAGRLAAPLPRMYADASTWHELPEWRRHIRLMRTLQDRNPCWTFCSFSAAVAHGLRVPRVGLDRIHIALPVGSGASSSSSVVRHRLPPFEWERVCGVAVTTAERTALDCMLGLSFPEALVVADSLLRLTVLTREEFLAYVVREARGRHGASVARQAARFSDARSESGGESLARARIIEEGFAVPDLQVEFPDPMGRGASFRVDFLWEHAGRKVIGEFDGQGKYFEDAHIDGRHGEAPDRGSGTAAGAAASGHASFSPRAVLRERRRESRLTAYGIPIVRFSYEDLFARGRFAALLDAFGVPRVRRGGSRCNGGSL